MRKLRYAIGEALTSLRRNKLMTAAATLTAAVSLLLLGGVLMLGNFVGEVTGQIEERVEVSVFLEDDATEEQQEDILQTLEGLDVVARVFYVSKEEAYEEFKDMYRDQPVLYENIDEDVLPASFRVSMADPERVDLIRSRLQDNPAVEEVADQRETVERLVHFTGLLRTFSMGMVAVLFVAAVLLIANTIQLAIYARRKEIEIMKLVGATNWFVRGPFMLEGIVQGVIGATGAILVLRAGAWFVREQLPQWIPTAGLHVGPVEMLWLLLLGVSIGALGSAVALRRFLEA